MDINTPQIIATALSSSEVIGSQKNSVIIEPEEDPRANAWHLI